MTDDEVIARFEDADLACITARARADQARQAREAARLGVVELLVRRGRPVVCRNAGEPGAVVYLPIRSGRSDPDSIIDVQRVEVDLVEPEPDPVNVAPPFLAANRTCNHHLAIVPQPRSDS